MKVTAVVISHGHADELERSLPALAPQVDELLVIANIPGSVRRAVPDGVRVLENDAPLSFAANANLGAATTRRARARREPGRGRRSPGPSRALREFLEAHPRAGAAGPQML